MRIYSGVELGNLGEGNAKLVTVHWEWWRNLARVGLWILLLTVLGIEGIRDRRQLLVVLPFLAAYAVVGLEFLLSEAVPSIGHVVPELTYGLIPFWTLVWLSLPLKRRTTWERTKLAVRLALITWVVVTFGDFAAGRENFEWHTYALCLAFAVAMCGARLICRKRYSPWRMIFNALVVMMVGGCIGLVVSDVLQYVYWGLPLRRSIAFVINWPPPQTLWSLCIVPALAPFMLLTYLSAFHRERFERVLRLNTSGEPAHVDTSQEA